MVTADVAEPVEVVTLKAVGCGVPDVPRAALAAEAALPKGVTIAEPLRQAYFSRVHGWRKTRVLNRADLAEPQQGPCIVEEYDSTCVVPPGSIAVLDGFGNILIDVPRAARV